MQYRKVLPILGFAISAVHAAGFSSECTDITFNTNWLIANCPNNAGTSITSSVVLPDWIENVEGTLVV